MINPAKQRFWLIPLALISCVYPLLHRALAEAHIYDIRWMGGLHPIEILQLRWAGNLTACVPAVVIFAFILSYIRPTATAALVAICVALCLLAQLLFLVSAVFVIVLNVVPPNA